MPKRTKSVDMTIRQMNQVMAEVIAARDSPAAARASGEQEGEEGKTASEGCKTMTLVSAFADLVWAVVKVVESTVDMILTGLYPMCFL